MRWAANAAWSRRLARTVSGIRMLRCVSDGARSVASVLEGGVRSLCIATSYGSPIVTIKSQMCHWDAHGTQRILDGLSGVSDAPRVCAREAGRPGHRISL